MYNTHRWAQLRQSDDYGGDKWETLGGGQLEGGLDNELQVSSVHPHARQREKQCDTA